MFFIVTGVWKVEADSAEDAENLVENAVAKEDKTELMDSQAEPADDFEFSGWGLSV